eukprot:291718_1
MRRINRSALLPKSYHDLYGHKHLIRYISHFKDSNLLSKTKHHNKITSSRISKQRRGEGDVISPAQGAPVNADIKTYIDNADSSKDILSMIKQNVKIIEHVSIFGKAMKKCDDLRDWESVHEIMKLLLSSDVQPHLIAFTIFFNKMISIYAKCREIAKGTKLFNEYLGKVQKQILKHNKPTYSAYLNLFSRIGDIEGMERANNIMQEAGYDTDVIILSDIMRG